MKMFELRDRGTFIPIVCINCRAIPIGTREYKLLRSVGYSSDQPTILMTSLHGGKVAHCDPYAWGDRTYNFAHQYIEANWHKLSSGDVIDVEYILGETSKPKESQL